MLTFEEMAAREDEMAELYAWIENDGARADDGASAADGVSVKSPADVSDPDGGASAATAIYMETADYATPASAAAATRARGGGMSGPMPGWRACWHIPPPVGMSRQ